MPRLLPTPIQRVRCRAASAAPLGLALLLAACASSARPVADPAPPASDRRALDQCCGDDAMGVGLRIATDYREAGLTARSFTAEQFWSLALPVVTSAGFAVEEVGRSVQGRPLRTVTIGRGRDTVLLWSQMHGNESTATMALADLFRWFANTRGETRDDALRARLLERLTLVFLPLLNPDGAEHFQRENALGVDINRDARALVTPEARALKAVRDRWRPAFGFNLHDQNARTRVGPRGVQAAFALLAPPAEATRAYGPVRARARLVAATLARAFATEVPARVAKYDDGFNPRAFGDLMQQWGTSTVLIESGALPGDPEKQRLRAVHVAALLVAFDALATGAWREADAQWYDALPFNTGGASDLLVRGAQLVLPGRAPARVDLAINYDDAVARTGGRVREVGDLDGVVALDTLTLEGRFLHPHADALRGAGDATVLPIGAPAVFDVREGPSPASPLVRRIGG
ncbi:MAG TPA: M14 family zinc carboxypeptidase [Gemmatimonadaceae bacterium]|nr:M14 family zinc carboxypeptidase [Gemmatimonadaceae bacterium]